MSEVAIQDEPEGLFELARCLLAHGEGEISLELLRKSVDGGPVDAQIG